MPLTPEELLDRIACLKRDRPTGWRMLVRQYVRTLRSMVDPDDPEAHLTIGQFPESIGRRHFPAGRGLIPFWNQPIPRPEYSTDEEFEL
jgi:hypothetical protein